MKKRTLKSLDLKKRAISNIETAKVNGGSMTASMTCTLGTICIEIIEATIEISQEITDYTN
ncbi:hypothetical protein [uncultured Kordia sp.]|uniref:hypothetical protein n=1 Tax=uncultured Kordia sp. TaxID=507699 RepID=UPI0026181E76|nr:hypothetical protein [uncultured Kordia sp.]